MRKTIIEQSIGNQLPVDESGIVKSDIDSDIKRDEEYLSATVTELNAISLAYAEKSFKDGWDSDDREENDFWNSFHKEIEKTVEKSGTFQFLHDEPDIYTDADIKRK